jgi:molybdate transport system substrate-binding protein
MPETHGPPIHGILIIVLSLFSLCLGSEIDQQTEQKEITVYVGACMMGALREITADFESENPDVKVNLVAKSNVKLMDILHEFKEGDVFIPDDGRVAAEAVEAGYMDDYEVVATSRLVIFVPDGNPLDINSLEDIKNDKIRVVIGRDDNPMGISLREILNNATIIESITDNYVCIEETKCGAFPLAILNGEVDAAISCSPSGLRTEGIEIIDVPEFQDAKFTVTVGVLEFSKEKELSKNFSELVSSETGKAYLEKYGYDAV